MKKQVARGASATLVCALALGTLGVAPASAALPPAQNTTSFCTNAPSGFGGFSDIGGTIHRRPIECLAFAGIVQGKTSTTYVPGDPVTRGQMASFIARAIDKANELENVTLQALPTSPPDRFVDDNGSTHEANINRLAAAGIVTGTSATTFTPAAVVTRAQMATFIANAQKFLSNNAAPFTTTEDFFVDDESSVHEANINGIAAAGITQGVDRIHYAPGAAVERANMATFIARYLAVLHASGAIDALPAAGTTPPPPPGTPPSNATIAFTPTTDARLTAAVEPSAADERTYTATGLNTGPYRVTLFDASLVTVDPGPVYTFTEDGVSNFALADRPAPDAPVGGFVVALNGVGITPSRSVGSISAVNGQITVTVDAEKFGRLLPVIFPDQPGENTRLNLGDQNRPSEPFGVGGKLETIPQNGSTAALGVDALVMFNDEAADLIVASKDGVEVSYLYDSNDSYYLDTVAPANQLTQGEFELRLSKGDRLDALSFYQANPALPSTFILENVSPAPPTASVASVGDTSAIITINDLLPGATANVYLGPDNASFAGTTVRASTAVDGNPAEPGFQVNLNGLTPATSYEYYVTQRSEGEESRPLYTTPGPQTQLITTAAVPPSVTAASVNGGRAGTTTNQINVDFSEAVTALGRRAGQVHRRVHDRRPADHPDHPAADHGDEVLGHGHLGGRRRRQHAALHHERCHPERRVDLQGRPRRGSRAGHEQPAEQRPEQHHGLVVSLVPAPCGPAPTAED